MLKYSKSYIEQLLFCTEPIKAVYALCNIWSARPNRSEDRQFFGFSEPEFHVHCYLHYAGEVGNGGHYQFFINPFGRHSKSVSSALLSLQFRRASDIFTRACSAIPSHDFNDDAARKALMKGLSQGVLERLHALDREFYAADRDYWPRLLNYLREHDSDILQEERR